MDNLIYISQCLVAVLSVLKSMIDCVKSYYDLKRQDEKKEGSVLSKDKPSK